MKTRNPDCHYEKRGTNDEVILRPYGIALVVPSLRRQGVARNDRKVVNEGLFVQQLIKRLRNLNK